MLFESRVEVLIRQLHIQVSSSGEGLGSNKCENQECADDILR